MSPMLMLEMVIVEHKTDEFGGTNANNVYDGEVDDGKLEDLDSRKEMTDEFNKKTRNSTIVIYV